MILTTVVVTICVLIHYETLRLISDLLIPRLGGPPRSRLLVVMAGAFIAHTIEVWAFAIAYYLFSDRFGLGTLEGHVDRTFAEFLYFSTQSYTSLGFGDVYPVGGLRLVAGVEALLGLLMIGWTVSFTYLEMQQLWNAHPARGRSDAAKKR
jgi:hypothetical protein